MVQLLQFLQKYAIGVPPMFPREVREQLKAAKERFIARVGERLATTKEYKALLWRLLREAGYDRFPQGEIKEYGICIRCVLINTDEPTNRILFITLGSQEIQLWRDHNGKWNHIENGGSLAYGFVVFSDGETGTHAVTIPPEGDLLEVETTLWGITVKHSWQVVRDQPDWQDKIKISPDTSWQRWIINLHGRPDR